MMQAAHGRKPPSRQRRKPAIAASMFACVTAAAVIAASAMAASASTGAHTPKLQQAMNQLIAAGVPGVVAVVRDGNRTASFTSGVRDLKTKAPIRATDRYRIGSVAKTFVATVVLQLVREGKLSLDDNVEHWLPGLVPNGKNITIRHLLGHRSGLYDFTQDPRVTKPYFRGDFAYYWPPRKLVQISVQHKPTTVPGAAFLYSATDYVLAGLIVQAATGDSLPAELAQRIFKPLGLKQTTFDVSGRIAGAHSSGYYVLPNGQLQDVTALSPSWYWAAGNIVSTANDVTRFYRALFGGRLLSPQLLREMMTTAADQRGHLWGLGIDTSRLSCGTYWGHDGATPGYDTVAYSSKDGLHQAVVYVNSITLTDKVGNAKAQKAWARVVDAAYCSSS
jgi:D-alanyl-D-alanine carboxypeptidase